MFAAVAALASCDEKPVTPQEQEEPKSEECRLTAFVVTVGTQTIEGFVDQTDKSIELSYLPDHLAGLKAATAVATISDKATITPDPAQAIDYTVDGGVEFTVTAEDGEHIAVYTVYIAPAEFSEKCEKKWQKTFGEIGLTAKANNDCGVAFVSTDKVAFADCTVFDLEGNKVGVLNTTGVTGLLTYGDGKIIAEGQIANMSNDDNGVLVAITTYEGTYADGSTVGCRTEVYAWKDGWDKAPTKIYGPVDYQCRYMSVSGDVNGDFVLNFRTGAGNPQMHHVLVYKGGKYYTDEGKPACNWYGPTMPHSGTDGCWGQQLSFFSGDPEEGFVCWDSLERGEDSGNPTNRSHGFFYYSSLSGAVNQTIEEVPLRGQADWSHWDQEGGRFGYGNHSYGHVRAFKYNGEKYIVASTGSWTVAWITIQKADNLVEDDPETEDIDEYEANYLLPTAMEDGGGDNNPVSSAYVLDPATGVGHVIFVANGMDVCRYDLVTTIL